MRGYTHAPTLVLKIALILPIWSGEKVKVILDGFLEMTREGDLIGARNISLFESIFLAAWIYQVRRGACFKGRIKGLLIA